jgi:hypothetical protein
MATFRVAHGFQGSAGYQQHRRDERRKPAEDGERRGHGQHDR